MINENHLCEDTDHVISHNNYQECLKNVGKSCSRMSIFRTGLRAPHMILAGALTPAGTVLVTPALDVCYK